MVPCKKCDDLKDKYSSTVAAFTTENKKLLEATRDQIAQRSARLAETIEDLQKVLQRYTEHASWKH